MAPDYFDNNKGYTKIVDVWALGILFDEILVRIILFIKFCNIN